MQLFTGIVEIIFLLWLPPGPCRIKYQKQAKTINLFLVVFG